MKKNKNQKPASKKPEVKDLLGMNAPNISGLTALYAKIPDIISYELKKQYQEKDPAKMKPFHSELVVPKILVTTMRGGKKEYEYKFKFKGEVNKKVIGHVISTEEGPYSFCSDVTEHCEDIHRGESFTEYSFSVWLGDKTLKLITPQRPLVHISQIKGKVMAYSGNKTIPFCHLEHARYLSTKIPDDIVRAILARVIQVRTAIAA